MLFVLMLLLLVAGRRTDRLLFGRRSSPLVQTAVARRPRRRSSAAAELEGPRSRRRQPRRVRVDDPGRPLMTRHRRGVVSPRLLGLEERRRIGAVGVAVGRRTPVLVVPEPPRNVHHRGRTQSHVAVVAAQLVMKSAELLRRRVMVMRGRRHLNARAQLQQPEVVYGSKFGSSPRNRKLAGDATT